VTENEKQVTTLEGELDSLQKQNKVLHNEVKVGCVMYILNKV